MLKWKYGNYQFGINPNSHSANIEMVGDEVRNLDGTLISQPTMLQEKYNVSSVFFQQRSKALSQVSLLGESIELNNNQFFVLNKANDRIDIYSNTFSYVSFVSLTALPNKNYITIAVETDGFWILSDNVATNIIYKINNTGALTVTGSTTTDASGIVSFAGHLWILRVTGRIDKIRIADLVTVSTLVLPFGLKYSGLSSDGSYCLIVGNNDDYSKFYHVNYSTAEIVNQVTFENIQKVVGVAFDSSKFYVIGNGQLQTIFGNTVDKDLCILKDEVKLKGYVNLIDDMGVTTRVSASDLSYSRRLDYEHLYDVSMAIAKVDRG